MCWFADWVTLLSARSKYKINGDVSKRKCICYREGDENILRVWRFLSRVNIVNIWEVQEADWCWVANLQKNKPYRSIILTYNNTSAGCYT